MKGKTRIKRLEVDFSDNGHLAAISAAEQVDQMLVDLFDEFTRAGATQGIELCEDCFWSRLAAIAIQRSMNATPDMSPNDTFRWLAQRVMEERADLESQCKH